MALTIAAILAFTTLFAYPAQAVVDDVTIVGQVIVGETLTIALTDAVPVGNTSALNTSYQWQRGWAGSEDFTNITGATANSYTVTGADEWHTVRIRVNVTRNNPISRTRFYSDWTPTVVAAALPALPEGTASISGAPIVGGVVTVAATGWPEGTTLGYQWGWRDGELTGDIGGATESTFTVPTNLVGRSLEATVSASNANFNPSSAVVVATMDTAITALQLPAAAAPVSDSAGLDAYLATGGVPVAAQTSAGLPTGSLNQDESHPATFSWGSADSFVDVYAYSTPVLVGTFPVVNGQVPIVLSSDLLMALAAGSHTLVVSGQSSGTVQTIAFSIAAVAAAPTEPVDTTVDPPVVTIVGKSVVGETLTADEGTWDADTAYTYQWFKIQMEPWVETPIDSATGASYELTDADLGFAYRLMVTGILGTSRFSVSSPATNAVVEAPRLALEAGTASISGTPVVGNELTANSTGWPTGTALTYEWFYSGGQFGGSIDGATSSAYTVTDEFVGLTIGFIVTGTLSGFESSTASSTTDALVTAPKATAAAAPVADSTALAAFLTIAGVETGTQESAGLPTGSLAPGQGYTANLAWFSGDSFVDVYAYSTPVLVGTFAVVNGEVRVTLSSAMLSALGAGAHTLVITGQSSGDVRAVAFSLHALASASASVSASASAAALASTGFATAVPFTAATLLLMLGATLVVARRHRRATSRA
ncbi:hypothetical protein E3O45_05380 [Cryobacterium sp. TMS1-20-1]|uniref:hypothetical protein n=1 Tax=Cryobacterium sp. TMS1-20-1 TaxID=1259223 RepID=UPI00106BF42C|nr:hypothetical protein [Cryobacterium sp. TMS1-20-1]TFC78934.1 hypothetical protein E3O45_05380 [Cryobacterium sp. TMS1-20-1]